MKLLTPEIINDLPRLYSTEGIAIKDRIVICKFSSPVNNWQWFVFEGEPFTYKDKAGNDIEDVRCFGVVHGFEKEMGYFLLTEISPCTVIDLSVFKVRYGDLINQ